MTEPRRIAFVNDPRGGGGRRWNTRFSRLILLLLWPILIVENTRAQTALAPLDTSSPRATLESFLDGTDEVSRCYLEYRSKPNRTTRAALVRTAAKTRRLLDLSAVPPVARRDIGSEAMITLWDVIARLELPDLADVPGLATGEQADASATLPKRWRIPGTDIAIVRVEEGPRAGEYLFSQETVSRASEYFEAVQDLRYQRPPKIKDLHLAYLRRTGELIPPSWAEEIPGWANVTLLGQMLWKWIIIGLLYVVGFCCVLLVLRWSARQPKKDSIRSFLRRLSTPASILAVGAIVEYLAIEQVNVTGSAGSVPIYVAILANLLAWIWISWLAANWVAATIIASPRISARSVDAQLISLTLRSAALLVSIILVFRAGTLLGLPVYGLVAGAGVGGIAVALATKNTLENFVGALHIFADRPVRVGDICRFDDDHGPGWRSIGQVQSIGLRSIKIRDWQRCMISIPNAEFAQRQIVNLSACDKMLMETTIGVRYETTDDQLRHLLAKLRELLYAHPKVTNTKKDPLRVRFVGFGKSSLDIQLRAYIQTNNRHEFLAIQEDIFLRCMKIVQEAGTRFAFPSRTVYQARDEGLDHDRQREAEQTTRQWVAAQNLPFPEFADDHQDRITDTLNYPPDGSPDGKQHDG